MLCLVTQLCLNLCNPMDCSLPGSSVHGNSPGKNTGVGCHALLQGIFPSQGSNPGLPHGRQILYHLSHQESWWWWFNPSVMSNSLRPHNCNLPGSSVHGVFQARILEWVAISFSRGYVKSSRNIVYMTFFSFFRLVNIFRLELVDQHRKEVVTKSDKQEQ